MAAARTGAATGDRQRTKVLLITAWFPRNDAPVSGLFVQDQAEVLSEVADVLVCVLHTVPGRRLIQDHFGRIPQPAGRARYAKVDVAYHGMPNAARSLASRIGYSSFRRRMRRVLHEWGTPHIVHAHVALPAGWVGCRLARDLGIPCVLTEHSGPFSALLPNAGLRGAVGYAVVSADALVAVSPSLAAEITREFPRARPMILGNVVRTDLFTPPGLSTSGPFQFSALALMAAGKGIDVLLQATSRLVERRIGPFSLVIAGDGHERVHLEALTQRLGLSGQVRFTGLLRRNEVVSMMQRTDVFVLPSLAETFGLAAAEAMACGKPVIATRCGGPEFVVGEHGVLIPPNDVEALASAMQLAFQSGRRADPEARASIDRRFGPAAFRHAMLETYRSAASRRDQAMS